jgi:hypothetical protein
MGEITLEQDSKGANELGVPSDRIYVAKSFTKFFFSSSHFPT